MPTHGPLVLWLLFVSWAIHDIEEVVLYERVDIRDEAAIRKLTLRFPFAGRLAANLATTRKEAATAVAVVGMLILAATLAGYLDPHGYGIAAYGIALGGYFVHAFTHAGASAVLRKYTPGVVTGLVVVVPASICIYAAVFDLGLMTAGHASWLALAGLILFPPSAFAAHGIMRMLRGRPGP